MFCPNCGLQQADATNFCLRCGADLTKKREHYSQIAAGATHDLLPPPSVSSGDEVCGDRYDRHMQADNYESSPSGQAEAAPAPSASRIQPPLQCLGLRRLCCFPTFLACLTYGIFSWLSHYEELMRCFGTLEEPSFGWQVLVSISTLTILGILQALIGMGTLYSRQALGTAFVMSTACSIIGLNYTPWGWKIRLSVFGAFALCAIIEAASVIGPIEKRARRTQAQRRAGVRMAQKTAHTRRVHKPKR